MSKRHKSRRHYPVTPPQKPFRNPYENPNEFALTDGAIKTYLNQEVALLRPQVGHAELSHLYRLAVTARAAIDLRAISLRQVDFKFGDQDGELIEPDDLTPAGRSAQLALQVGFQSIIERMEVSYCVFGEVLLRRLYDGHSRLNGFQWINNNFFRRQTDPMYGLKGFHVRPVWGSDLDPDIDWLAPEETVYMHTMDFFEDFGGTGALAVAYAQAATETEITATQMMFFRNMAMPSFVIQPAAGGGYAPGPDQKEQLTEYLRRMHQGAANVNRTAVLPSRWELLKFQQEFDKLGMPQLTEQARDAVVRILRVPIELLEPKQAVRGSGTKFYDQKREWLISWLVPQAELYADVFTEQIAQPLNPNWRIIPTFTRVRGLDEDVSSRTQTVKEQVGMAALDLYTAQEILGLSPDKNLKGIYLINGIPVPSEQFAVYHQYAPGNPGAVSGGELAAMDKPSKLKSPKTPVSASDKAPKTPNSSAKPKKSEEANDPIPFLPDSQYRELKSWRFVVERKGPLYAFEAKALPAHTVAYGRLLLALYGNSDNTWNDIRVQAIKTYDDTESQYRTALYEAMQDAFTGNVDRMQFGVIGRSEISMAFLNAFSNGLQDGGADPAEMTVEEKEVLAEETKQERGYWIRLANQMFNDVLPLKGTAEFQQASEKMLDRIELWVNAGLRHVYDLGKGYASLNSMKKWVYGGTVAHCQSCDAANGQVHRMRTWLKYLTPRSEECLCTGINCQCELVDTAEKASGSLAGVPLATGSKSHEHIPEDHTLALEVAV